MKASDGFTKAIQEYLDSERLKDMELGVAMQTKEDRNIEGCCKYIIGEAKKKADKSNAIAMTPDEVFAIAKNYWMAEVIEVPKPVVAKVQAPVTPVTPPKPKAPDHGVGDLFSMFDEPVTTEEDEAEN